MRSNSPLTRTKDRRCLRVSNVQPNGGSTTSATFDVEPERPDCQGITTSEGNKSSKVTSRCQPATGRPTKMPFATHRTPPTSTQQQRSRQSTRLSQSAKERGTPDASSEGSTRSVGARMKTSHIMSGAVGATHEADHAPAGRLLDDLSKRARIRS